MTTLLLLTILLLDLPALRKSQASRSNSPPRHQLRHHLLPFTDPRTFKLENRELDISYPPIQTYRNHQHSLEMSEFNRLQGERVFCHQCSHEWNRVEGGLLCPNCDSEFTEVVCSLDPSALFDFDSARSKPRVPVHVLKRNILRPEHKTILSTTTILGRKMCRTQRKMISRHINGTMEEVMGCSHSQAEPLSQAVEGKGAM